MTPEEKYSKFSDKKIIFWENFRCSIRGSIVLAIGVLFIFLATDSNAYFTGLSCIFVSLILFKSEFAQIKGKNPEELRKYRIERENIYFFDKLSLYGPNGLEFLNKTIFIISFIFFAVFFLRLFSGNNVSWMTVFFISILFFINLSIATYVNKEDREKNEKLVQRKLRYFFRGILFYLIFLTLVTIYLA